MWTALYEKENFLPVTEMSSGAAQGISAPILVCEPDDDHKLISLKVSRAYIFSCLLLKSHSYPAHATDRSHYRNYVAQSIFLIIRDDAIDTLVSERQRTTKASIITFV